MMIKGFHIGPGRRYLSIGLLLSTGLFLGVVFSSFIPEKRRDQVVAEAVKQAFLADLHHLHQRVRELTRILETIPKRQGTITQAQASFYEVKEAYKQVEYLLEYLDPELGKKLNGAPIPKVEIEQQPYLALGIKTPTHVTHPPEGLQVMEELLFGDDPERDIKTLFSLAYRLEEKIAGFSGPFRSKMLTDKHVLESLREQLIRVMALGITGFDAPAAGRELAHAAVSLEPVRKAVLLYAENDETANSLAGQLQKTINYLRQNPDFETFDRLYFIRELADPAYGALTVLQKRLLPESLALAFGHKPVNDLAASVFDRRFLAPTYYAKQDQQPGDQLVALGQLLFFDPVLSSNNERSCASCHFPAQAFTDGRRTSLAFDFKGSLQRNSPTLLNAIFSKAYFWDSRVEYLQDQVQHVLTREDELHGTYEAVVRKLRKSSAYKNLFSKAFPQQPKRSPINANSINRAIAAYVLNLVALDSPFDLYMRRETEAFPDEAKRGFNLFMGKAACGTCHFIPIFNGTVPPRFLESESEVLGMTADADFQNPVLDQDRGRMGIISAEAFNRSFKTPTVRNVALTAPYMHNGAFETLEQVLEFYDAGGGVGLGLVVPNQTLPPDRLNLAAEEKQDLLAFMRSLTDTTGFYYPPSKLPRFQGEPSINKRIVGGRY
jgi:cytochrome c peroxidase